MELKLLFHFWDPTRWVKNFKFLHIQFGEMMLYIFILTRVLIQSQNRECSVSTTLFKVMLNMLVLWEVIKIKRNVSKSRGRLLLIPIMQFILQFLLQLLLQQCKITMNLTAKARHLVYEHLHKVGGSFFFHVGSLCVSSIGFVGLNHVMLLQKGYEWLISLWLASQDGHNGVGLE